MYCIDFNNIKKNFGNNTALNDLTININCGDSVSLIGPNGAGKSTTIKILAGLLEPDSGDVLISGYKPDAEEAKKIIGYLPEDASPYLTLSVRENLEYLGALRGIDDLNYKTDFFLDFLKLREYERNKVSSLSRGNRQKLSLALAIMHEPKILLLDEPLNYLDIPSQEDVIKYFKKMDATFLVSTHIMSIAERFTDNIVIINRGQKIWEGQIKQLKNMGDEENASMEAVISQIMGGL